jgi:tryptophanyl-tRNA synthetase
VVLSGIQANGELHIGNYIGALAQWAAGQHRYRSYFCIADLHALTVPQLVVATDLRSTTRRVAALYVACGIDPAESAIFRQSDVPQHTELMWVLSCLTPIGWLFRMTQFKAKASSGQADSEMSGLLAYPVLQAADILLYHAALVPIGEDQLQHIEITRDIARRFNHLYGETFPEPEPLLPTVGARIMGLDEPTKKMSKSIAAHVSRHAINLLDSPDAVARKIASAVTDTNAVCDYETASPGVQNLLSIIAALEHTTPRDVGRRFPNGSYRELKAAATESINGALSPIRQRYEELMKDPGAVDSILSDGADRATSVAVATMTDVREKLRL